MCVCVYVSACVCRIVFIIVNVHSVLSIKYFGYYMYACMYVQCMYTYVCLYVGLFMYKGLCMYVSALFIAHAKDPSEYVAICGIS